jgi:hypothetical protein
MKDPTGALGAVCGQCSGIVRVACAGLVVVRPGIEAVSPSYVLERKQVSDGSGTLLYMLSYRPT